MDKTELTKYEKMYRQFGDSIALMESSIKTIP